VFGLRKGASSAPPIAAFGVCAALIAAGCGGSGNSTSTPASTQQTTPTAPTATTTAPTPTTTSAAKPPSRPQKPTSTTPPVSGSGPQSDRAAIVAALPALPYPQGSYRLKVKVSKRFPGWAAVYIVPAPGFSDQVQPDSASFVKSGGRWRVHQSGNGGGCGVPAAVRTELKLACY